MDPISVTASAIAFATAVKDLVELGRKIHESFAKVSRNRRNAQRAADSIMDMIEEIGVFCEDNEDTMTNMTKFTVAIQRLLKKLRDFETSILPLVPQRSGFWRSVSFLRGWWDNNKIEERILDLERDIREARRRYILRSSMRAEVKLEVVHQDTTRGLADISYGLDIVRRDVSVIRLSTPATAIAPTTLGTSDERERNVLLFVRSAMSGSTSLRRPPDEITEEVWMTAFIKSQVYYIEAEVAKISAPRIFDQSDAEPFSIGLLMDHSMEISCLRRELVRELMDLRDFLSDIEGLQANSVDQVAMYLNHISWQLSVLGLEEESQLFLDWTIKLARALVNVPGLHGQPQHHAKLALYLHRLLHHCGDMTRSQQAIEESLSIADTLLSQDCADTEIQGLCVDILIRHARYTTDNESAINRCMQAIRLMEDILNVQIFVRGAVLDPCHELVDHVFSSSPQSIMVSRFADALRYLAVYTLRAGKSKNAKRLAHLIVALRRRMVSIHGHAHRTWLASTLSSICRGKLAQCFTEGELLNLVDECMLLFRQLTRNNPVYYSQHLLYILWKRADILDQLNRYSDSISAREEAVSLAGQDLELQADALFRLAQGLRNAHRHLDAARTMARIPSIFWNELHGSLYRSLSRSLLKMRHYKESAEAAENSITIYRTLTLQHSQVRWVRGTIRAYCALGLSLISLGNEAQGIHTLKEAMTSAANFLTASSSDSLPNKLNTHLLPFEKARYIHNYVDDNTPIHLLECLVTRHPQNKEILGALRSAQASHAYHLYRLGKLQDALEYLGNWDRNLAIQTYLTSSLEWVMWIKTKTLSAQGDLLQALSEIQSHRSASGLRVCNYYMFMSAVHEAQINVALADWKKGLEISKQLLEHSRSHPGRYQWRTIMALHGLAYASLHAQNFDRTIEAAGEGIELSIDPEWMADGCDEDISIHPSFFAMMSSAQANTGNISRAMDFAQQAVTLSLDIAERKHDISSITAKHSLMETRGYLAEVLLAIGELKQARQICNERRDYFTERVKDRMGEYRDLAPILRMLGVLCCHEGRHEEGEAAASELAEMINRLGLVFPSLQHQVKVRLRYQASVLVLKVLDDLTGKLDCEHQKGITALFKD